MPVASQRVVEDIRGRQRRGAGCREGALHRELYPAASATSIHDRLSDPGKLPTPGGQPSGVFLCGALSNRLGVEAVDLAVFSLLLLHSRVCRRTAFKYCARNGTSGTGQRERGSELASASNVECVSGKREFATRDKGAERVELIMRMIELSARRHCQQSAEGDGKKGRWVHQHANGPSSWRRDARHFGSTQPRLLMRNCGIGFNLAQISCPTPNMTRLTSHWI